jgi:ribA/ribD-fused uncharacterized protein
MAHVEAAVRSSGFTITEVICGGAQGADNIGRLWARINCVPSVLMNADWDTHGRRAGYLRNIDMADKAEALIAVWDGASPGTRQMIEIATRMGLKVHVHRWDPQGDVDDAIRSFSGKYRFLSNFWTTNIIHDGHIYPSVENAYQAAKMFPSMRAVFRSCSAAEAKRRGRTMPSMFTDEGWNKEKVSLMTHLIRQKFESGYLRDKLLETGDRHLEEGNGWGDTFWGVSGGIGRNELGRILMETRARLSV